MKKTVLALALALMSGSAMAGIGAINQVNRQIAVDATNTHVSYTETGDGSPGTSSGTQDTETGNVPGFRITASYMGTIGHSSWLRHLYLDASYGRSSGNTNYVGAPFSGGTYGSLVGTDGATITNYSGRLGRGFVVDPEVMLTPYLEFGHHEWDRGVNQGETYTNNYFAVGALVQYAPDSIRHLVVTADAMTGTTYGANIDVAGTYGFSGGLGSSGIYRLGLNADYALTHYLHANVGVSYEDFKYGKSAYYPAGGKIVFEPNSETQYTVLEAGLGYSF